MTKLETTFQTLKKQKQTAFIPFITAGDPNLNITYDLILKLERAGSDVIELGMPFSDPMADGPTIQKANERSLAGGCTLEKILNLIKRVRKVSQVPILLMGYYNPILQFGLNDFSQKAQQVGVDALLIVDLPAEEAGDLRKALAQTDIHLVYLLTPTSTKERIDLVNQYGSGFVYYVSMTGTTGAQAIQTKDVVKQIKKIKRQIKLPLCVGFGISTPEDVKSLKNHCDGVVVGSALIKKLENSSHNQACINLVNLSKSLIKSAKSQ